MTYTIYYGCYTNKRKFGKCKIGITSRNVEQRAVEIANYDGEKRFSIFATHTLECSYAKALLIESVIRFGFSRKLAHNGNDHFNFTVEVLKNQITEQIKLFNNLFTKAIAFCGDIESEDWAKAQPS